MRYPKNFNWFAILAINFFCFLHSCFFRDKKRDYDFLSSLELIIVDQADVYIMQNWEHMLHLFDHTHLQPQESHGVDFSRVTMWALSGWSKFYRQTLVFGDFETPEMNSLLSAQARSILVSSSLEHLK